MHNKLEKQSNESKRQLKSKHYKEVVDKINSENEATMVNRLYGFSISLSKWDKERKKKYFETVPEAEKRSSAETVKVKTGLKNKRSCGIIFIISNRHSCFGNSCIMDSYRPHIMGKKLETSISEVKMVKNSLK